MFGGQADNLTNTIARLDGHNYNWDQIGMMNILRKAHNVIFLDSFFLVAGGAGNVMSEKCQLLKGKMFCSEQTPMLDNYYACPELFLIESDYCQQLPCQ